ncbi:MAG: ATP-binding protein [Chloroflexi bacterium]|nr:ATP-binding protein [Chloroflexota bacterium]
MTGYPDWFQQLRTYYASNSARMFVLHFNVDDYIMDPEDAETPITRVVPFLERYARRTQAADGSVFNAIFRYSRSLDVVPDDDSDTILGRLARSALAGAGVGALVGRLAGGSPAGGALAGAGVGAGVGTGVGAVVAQARTSDTFGHQIYTTEERSVPDLREPDKVLRVLERILRSSAHRSLVIIEHVETLAPRGATGELRVNGEILSRWATDYVFRSTDNLCILITRDLQEIDPAIYAPGTNCFPIQIDLPNEAERAAFLNFMEQEAEEERRESGMGTRRMRRALISGLAQIDPKLREALERGQQATSRADQLRVLGTVAQGFRLVEIDQLNRQVRAQHEMKQTTSSNGSSAAVYGNSPFADEAVIRLDDIKRHKRRAINEQSNGLLEIIDTNRGFDAIGGMETVKQYLHTLSRRILANNVDGRYNHLIPRGLILSGPPGTGKTIIAEALALESNLNMVKLRNVREGLVGQSERNLRRAFDVIKALSPILVFVDEIDQAFGNRGLGQSSDGGTSERIFGQILEFIGDDRNRGHVIWMAATNRPDVLDAALLRRFDRIIPCLLPTPDEQALILEAMPKSIKTLQYTSALSQLISQRSPDITHLLEHKRDVIPTGAVIETIVRRATEFAGDRNVSRTLGEANAASAALEVGLNDLRLAVEDYRSNANAMMYDYQSLLAIQACNFYSVMPQLPERTPFTDLIEQRDVPLDDTDSDGAVIPPFWRTHRVSYSKLEEQILGYRVQLGLIRRIEGGSA